MLKTTMPNLKIALFSNVPENELSKTAGVKVSPITGGAEVGDNLETSVAGIIFSAKETP